MELQMLLSMVTEDDDEPLTRKQWMKEMDDILVDVCNHINREHSTYVKKADGEYAFEDEGKYLWKKFKEGE